MEKRIKCTYLNLTYISKYRKNYIRTHKGTVMTLKIIIIGINIGYYNMYYKIIHVLDTQNGSHFKDLHLKN